MKVLKIASIAAGALLAAGTLGYLATAYVIREEEPHESYPSGWDLVSR